MIDEKTLGADGHGLVSVTIDGLEVKAPQGSNIIEAAKLLGIEIPHYCYHPCLSVVGNCRMCQVEVEGAPKLMIACHTRVQPGMKIKTHRTSEAVREAQAAVLEFILINHPLDCTVCDQSGHCKLQDYYFAFSRHPSRFSEEKEHKVKAEPLGPTVIYDGERCILCTRCVRFCDEITKSFELGVLRRGDRCVIGVNPGKQLDNPLSGCVVDLCPVGALTHRRWRFNTRIWFTAQSDTICPACSTGCNCRVAVRDGQVVMVKGRYHPQVNKEWMCDEGRYGFDRFLPKQRITAPRLYGKEDEWDRALGAWDAAKGKVTLVLLSPVLLLEEYVLIKRYLDRFIRTAHVALAYRERALSEVESILVSPDRSANFRGAEYAGLLAENPAKHYLECLSKLKKGVYQAVFVIGEGALFPEDLGEDLLTALGRVEVSAGVICDAESPLSSVLQIVYPGRSVLEKSGLMINRTWRLQYLEQVVDYPVGSEPEWRIVSRLAERGGMAGVQSASYRDFTNAFLAADPRLSGLTIKAIKFGGVEVRGAWKF